MYQIREAAKPNEKNRMKKVFCLGLHKTGSSSLQSYLLQNQLALLKSGILYPPVEPQGISRLLAEAAGQRPLHQPARLNEYMGHNALAYRIISDRLPEFKFPDVHRPMLHSQMALTLIKELAQQLRSEAIVFCSEDLARCSFMLPDGPKTFVDQFGSDKTTLLCTIRRPDEAISSWQCQKLRFGAPISRLQESGIQEYIGSVHLDYPRALQPWVDHFPDAKLILENYRNTSDQGGAIEQFRRESGLNLPNGLHSIADINQSIPYSLFDVARLAMSTQKPMRWQVLSYLETSKDRLSLPKNSEVDLIGTENRARLLTAFTPIHRRLTELSGIEPLFDDLDKIASGHRIDSLIAAKDALPALQADAKENCKNFDAREWLTGLQAENFIR
ncbi:sulfotransferase family protein [Cognatishimia activa]|uniref:Sulfotransferase domain protein n=1 Tax=Cognatishimia activa TaxID=1715691 RepID=A0A0P1IQH0_9RHOB|nr:sulfotransferase family protein [Cognatishimia activa]CUJ16954.1 hypothetical protein TA5113_02516 [Cognatishimia activa]CUK25830.1 hypothetical protein TA5114_01634 [Cognatishimia activa]